MAPDIDSMAAGYLASNLDRWSNIDEGDNSPLGKRRRQFDNEQKKKKPTLEATWWLFDREPADTSASPRLDDIMDMAQDSLQPMFDKLKMSPFQDQTKANRLFLAKFEFPNWGEPFTYRDAAKESDPNSSSLFQPYCFFDFLGGMPLDCCEMLLVVTEFTTPANKVTVQPGEEAVVPPIPEEFFEWLDMARVLFNITALASPNCDWMATDLPGESIPDNLHWWVRTFLGNKTDKETCTPFPLPGEFVAMAVRIMPDKPWGEQKTSPFIYSGNWFDTVFYTSGTIIEVLDPVPPAPYNTYRVRWRKTEGCKDGVIVAVPTDFAEYRVGERVTILKDIAATKTSQLWKDDDMTTPGDTWALVPITFYGDLAGQPTE
jgi:hypothetical protein